MIVIFSIDGTTHFFRQDFCDCKTKAGAFPTSFNGKKAVKEAGGSHRREIRGCICKGDFAGITHGDCEIAFAVFYSITDQVGEDTRKSAGI